MNKRVATITLALLALPLLGAPSIVNHKAPKQTEVKPQIVNNAAPKPQIVNNSAAPKATPDKATQDKGQVSPKPWVHQP